MDPIGLAKRAKDRRLRRDLLRTLHAARGGPGGGSISGRLLADLHGPQSIAVDRGDDDRHIQVLLSDLVRKGLVAERDEREFKWQPAGLDLSSYQITASGGSLVEQTIPADPDVEDDRR